MGGAGFIGSHLVETLREWGDALVVVDDLSTGRVENIAHLFGPRFEFVHGSVSDAKLTAELARTADVWVHLAPSRPAALDLDGVHVVLASSYRPLAGELRTATMVSLADTVGRGQTAAHATLLPRLVRHALAGEDVTVSGTGEQIYRFTHVFDAADALALLCHRETPAGAHFEIGSTHRISVIDLAHRVIERTRSGSRVVSVPADAAGPMNGELPLFDVRPLRRIAGWKPRQTLDAAIEDVILHESSVAVRLGSIADGAPLS